MTGAEVLGLIEAWFGAVWRASMAASVLIVALAASRWGFGRRISPRWLFWGGCLVALRLLIPNSFETGWSAANWLAAVRELPGGPRADASDMAGATLRKGPAESVAEGASDSIAAETGAGLAFRSEEAGLFPAGAKASEPLAPAAAGAVGYGASPGAEAAGDGHSAAAADLRLAAAVLWLVGAVYVFGRSVVEHGRFCRRLRRDGQPAAGEAARVLGACRKALPTRAPVTCLELDGVTSPAVIGTVRPVVVLPAGMADSLTCRELKHIFLHELSHVRCRDPLWNWFIVAARSLHWFNPLAWHALRRLTADRELVRDAMALGALGAADDDERRAYGHTLVKMAAASNLRSRLTPGLASLIHSEKEIHRRIVMIKSPVPSQRGIPVRVAGTLALAALGALTFTIAASQEAAPPRLAEDPALPAAPPPAAPGGLPAELPLEPAEEALSATPGLRPAAAPAPDAKESVEALPAPAEEVIATTPGRTLPAVAAEPVHVEAKRELTDDLERRLSEVDYELDRLRAQRRELLQVQSGGDDSMDDQLSEVTQEVEILSGIRGELVRQLYSVRYGVGQTVPAQAVQIHAPSFGGGSPRSDEVTRLRNEVAELRSVVADLRNGIADTGEWQNTPAEANPFSDAKLADELHARLDSLDQEETEIRSRIIDLETRQKTGPVGSPAETVEMRKEIAAQIGALEKLLLKLEAERRGYERRIQR